MLPPPLPTQVDLLQRVLDRVAVTGADGGLVPVVVFGVDGVLYDTRPRTYQVILEYAAEVRSSDPELAQALSAITHEQIHFLLSDTLRECGVHHTDVLRDLTSFWRDRFYSDDYVLLDQPAPGAVQFVNAIHRAGGTVVYLSGRDVPGMLLGTLTSLRDHGFPIATVGVQLALKPDATLGTETFKRQLLPKLANVGEVMAVFDDDLLTCKLATEQFEGADIALVDSWNDLKPGDPSDYDVIRDFRL